MKRVTALLLLAILAAFHAYAQAPQPKPNLSGTWIFSPQKSALKVPAPSSMTLEIAQNDPAISFSRTQVYGDQKYSWKLDTVADGQKEVVQDSEGYSTRSRVYWQSRAMVIEQKVTASDGTTVSDVVTYNLGDDGKTLEAVERQVTVGAKGSTTNKWVYEKKAE
jgi:hypothetical protein